MQYVLVKLEFDGCNEFSFSSWLVVGTDYEIQREHRLLGCEDIKDPNKLVQYWRNLGLTTNVDEHVAALCKDFATSHNKFPHYWNLRKEQLNKFIQ